MPTAIPDEDPGSIIASMNDFSEIVQLAIDAGADVNAKDRRSDSSFLFFHNGNFFKGSLS